MFHIKKRNREKKTLFLSMVAPFTQGWKSFFIPLKTGQNAIMSAENRVNGKDKNKEKKKKNLLEITM
ncbi:MAG: hypothetical protein EU532_02625 [Promethearchaeota archaeon]|nr:MAG: hypothetical protein EU532_02625 [Candidatus Lokiarchaeota archaeon]